MFYAYQPKESYFRVFDAHFPDNTSSLNETTGKIFKRRIIDMFSSSLI